MNKIRHNHPDLKGSFTCLGVWFNLLNKESMEELNQMLKHVDFSDKRTAIKEIREAKEAMKFWKPDPCLHFLYNKYEKENKLSKTS